MEKPGTQTTTISVRISVEDLEQIEKFAQKVGLPRSTFVCRILELGLDDVRAMDKVGLLSAVGSFRTTVSWLREKGMLPTPEK